MMDDSNSSDEKFSRYFISTEICQGVKKNFFVKKCADRFETVRNGFYDPDNPPSTLISKKFLNGNIGKFELKNGLTPVSFALKGLRLSRPEFDALLIQRHSQHRPASGLSYELLNVEIGSVVSNFEHFKVCGVVDGLGVPPDLGSNFGGR